MRHPSIKTIETRLNVDRDTAKKIRGIIDRSIEPDTVPGITEYIDECRSRPCRHMLQLYAIDILLEGHGVECLDLGNLDYEYVNMGDSYIETVLYHQDSRTFKVCSTGSIAEKFIDISND